MRSKKESGYESKCSKMLLFVRLLKPKAPNLFQTPLRQSSSMFLMLPADVLRVIAAKLDTKSLQELSKCSSALFALSKSIHLTQYRKQKLIQSLSSNDMNTVKAILVEQPGLWQTVLPLKSNNYQPGECNVKWMSPPTFAYWTKNPTLIQLTEESLSLLEISRVKHALSIRQPPVNDELDAGTHFKFEARARILKELEAANQIAFNMDLDKCDRADAIWRQSPAWARDAEYYAVHHLVFHDHRISSASNDDIISWVKLGKRRFLQGSAGLNFYPTLFASFCRAPGYTPSLRFLGRIESIPLSFISNNPG